ncbi:MAG: DoxX subfamily [Candidatus Zhuqueibacterota bacterium]
MPKRFKSDSSAFSNGQITVLVVLRMLIGWHLLYEGFSKLLNPYWSAASYLVDSKGIFAGLFKSILSNPGVLSVVDFLNEWGLIAIGLGLIAGVLTQAATIFGIVLLSLYYLSAPPFIGLTYTMPTEGAYLIVNKTLIEIAALFVLAFFPTGRIVGVDIFIFRKK